MSYSKLFLKSVRMDFLLELTNYGSVLSYVDRRAEEKAKLVKELEAANYKPEVK